MILSAWRVTSAEIDIMCPNIASKRFGFKNFFLKLIYEHAIEMVSKRRH